MLGFRVFHSDIRAGRSVRSGFVNFICFLVCEMCVNTINACLSFLTTYQQEHNWSKWGRNFYFSEMFHVWRVSSACHWLQEPEVLDKLVLFPEVVEVEDMLFISTNQVKEFLKYEAQVFVMFSSLQVGSNASMVDLHVVCEFLEVFPDDITDLSL